MSAAKSKKKQQVGQGAQVAIVAAALLLVAAAAFFLVVRPKQAEAKELDDQLAAVEAQIASRGPTTAAPRPKPVAYSDLYRMAKAMPDRADMPGLLLELNRVAKETGIVFQSISPGASAPAEGYQVVPITLVFEGNFYSLSDFLYRLRNLVAVNDGKLTATGRLFSVDSIAFAEGEQPFPNLTASLTVSAYVYGTAQPATSLPTPPGETTPTDETETVPAPSDGEQPAEQPAEDPPASAAPAGGDS